MKGRLALERERQLEERVREERRLPSGFDDDGIDYVQNRTSLCGFSTARESTGDGRFYLHVFKKEAGWSTFHTLTSWARFIAHIDPRERLEIGRRSMTPARLTGLSFLIRSMKIPRMGVTEGTDCVLLSLPFDNGRNYTCVELQGVEDLALFLRCNVFWNEGRQRYEPRERFLYPGRSRGGKWLAKAATRSALPGQ